MRFGDQVFVITGASAGIGAALARGAHRAGARVVLAARRVERLRELAEELDAGGERTLVVRCDVTNEADVQELVQVALRRFGGIDVLIANAGFGVVGAAAELELADYQRQLDTNLYGAIRCARAALPAIRERRGVLAFMGSVCGYFSMPGVTPYSVSKYALRAYAEGLGQELDSSGVRVLHVAPGFVESEFRQVDNRGRHRPDAADPVPAWLVCSAERAARLVLRAIARRRRELIVTRHGRLLVFLARHLPGVLGFLVRRTGVRGRENPASG